MDLSRDADSDLVSHEDWVRMLTELDDELSSEPVTAMGFLRHRDKGGSDAWDVRASDGRDYVLKFANNPQEPKDGAPPKVVATELICGRIGQLFGPAVTPEVAVISVPQKLIDEGNLKFPDGRIPLAGAAFGSEVKTSCSDTKDGGGIVNVMAGLVGPIVVFQTWLDAEDQVALVADDCSWALSVDHGYYFGSNVWNPGRLGGRGPCALRIPGDGDRSRFADRALFAPALNQLAASSKASSCDSSPHFPAVGG